MSKQHCGMLYKSNDSFDKIECCFDKVERCFDIVAVFLQQYTKFRPFDKVQTNRTCLICFESKQLERAQFVWTCSICFDTVERTKFYEKIVRRCFQKKTTMSKQHPTLSKKRTFTINSFDIVAVSNKVECCFEKVERFFGNIVEWVFRGISSFRQSRNKLNISRPPHCYIA